MAESDCGWGRCVGGATGGAGWGVGHGRYWVYGIMEGVLLPSALDDCWVGGAG